MTPKGNDTMANRTGILAMRTTTELTTTSKGKAAAAASARACVATDRDGKPTVDEAIRLGAYLKWEAAGMPGGDGVKFWLEAEKEIRNGH